MTMVPTPVASSVSAGWTRSRFGLSDPAQNNPSRSSAALWKGRSNSTWTRNLTTLLTNGGPQVARKPLMTSPRPYLYAPLSASRTTLATTLFRRCSHPLSSSSHVRCIVYSAHSQASAMPLFQNVLYPCLVLVAPSFSLYILYVLSTLVRHCYRLFFAVTPRGLVDGSLYHLYYPTCFSPSYHWTVYTELASAMKRLTAVLLGFLVFVASLNIEYTTIITLTKVFLLPMGP